MLAVALLAMVTTVAVEVIVAVGRSGVTGVTGLAVGRAATIVVGLGAGVGRVATANSPPPIISTITATMPMISVRGLDRLTAMVPSGGRCKVGLGVTVGGTVGGTATDAGVISAVLKSCTISLAVL